MIKQLIGAASRTIRGRPPQGTATAPAMSPASAFPADVSREEEEIWRAVRPYTMTSLERVVSLVRAVQYVVHYGIQGAFVECGVWRGGSMMAVAFALRKAGVTDRDIYLFDTYSGMPDARDLDIDANGRKAAELLSELRKLPEQDKVESDVLAQCSLEVTRRNVLSTGYPEARIHLVQGSVETTIPVHAPEAIALLRLDTDWYESTRHELVHLFPRVVRAGVLIIDDYGHWNGAKTAVDEYFQHTEEPIFFSRVDYTARLAIRQ